MRTLTLTLLLLACTLSLFAQPLALQSFENTANDTWAYTAEPDGMNRLVWWGRSDQPMGGASAQSGSWYWASWDIDNNEYSLTFDNVSLPLGYIHSLSFWYYSNGLDPATDYTKFCVEYDYNSNWTNWVILTPDTDAWTQVSIEIPQQASTVRLKFTAQYDGFAKYAHWDNISITNTPAPPSAPFVYNTSVAQRTDGSKLVDISYDLFDANGDLCEVALKLSSDGGITFAYIPNPANLGGDIGEGIVPGPGKSVVWDAGAEGIDFDGSQYVLQFVADDPTSPIPENFVFVPGGTIYPAQGIYTGGLTVSDFYIDKYELTNAEWNAVMGSGGGDSYPQAWVSWFGAIEYCNRRSIMESLPPCYSYLTYGTNPDNWPSGWNTGEDNAVKVTCDWNASGYRLPSEAEWEYAARGGLQTHGYTYSGSNDLNQVGWYSGNSSSTSHPVGQLAPNELGTFDMSGNLFEWVWDMHSGSGRVVRGGGWYHSAFYCTVLYRANSDATYEYTFVGFRVCRGSGTTVSTPVFNPPGGYIGSGLFVSITCATEGATIHYTTDGSEPDSFSPIYSSPIYIDETTTLKARGFKPGLTSSAIASANYSLDNITDPQDSNWSVVATAVPEYG